MIPRVARPARCLRRASTSPVSRRLRTNDGVSRTLTAFLVDRYHSLPRSYSYASCRTLARGLPTRAGAKLVTTRYAVQLHGTTGPFDSAGRPCSIGDGCASAPFFRHWYRYNEQAVIQDTVAKFSFS
jgi:hypothetical protein